MHCKFVKLLAGYCFAHTVIGVPDLTYVFNLVVNVALVINVYLLILIYKVTMWTEVQL